MFESDSLFSCYAFHEQKKMDIINRLAASDDPNDITEQEKAFTLAGASYNEFTDSEIEEMEREIARRRT
jgi:hypothetical protein